MLYKIPIETSARHIHISRSDFEKLFGPGAELTVKKELSQPGQFLSNQRLTIKGFIIFEEYGDHFPEFLKTMGEWVESGKVKTKEHIVDGLAQAPQAFFDMLEGKNFGKTVVKVADVQ